jgi:hypothetical protein
MPFYVFAAIVMYAVYKRAKQGTEWRCTVGHLADPVVDPGARCGAKVVATPKANDCKV